MRSEYFMRVATLTTCNENVREAETGNHKGCPYDGIVGAYFRSNDRGGDYGYDRNDRGRHCVDVSTNLEQIF